MLTVWSMCTGDAYAPNEVHVLRRQVKRHLDQPHMFICITEHEINGIVTMKPPTPFPGWWGKIGLHNVAAPGVLCERGLWLDLDVVITGQLDGLVEPLSGSQIRIAKNWAQSGYGGCQSSVMYWEGDSARVIYDDFDPSIAYWPPRNDGGKLWGDQEHCTALRDAGKLDVEYFDAADVVSYKYHCRQGLPGSAKVVVFHGKPDPHQVSDPWVSEARA